MSLSKRIHIALARLSRGKSLPRIFTVWLPWIVFALALGTTLFSWYQAREQARRELHTEFHFSVQEVARDIELRMETYKLLLHGLQGLFASSSEVSREEFHTYVETLEMKARYPGIQRVGFSLIIPENRRAAHIAAIRAEGFRDYDIRPEGQRDPITANIYIEPFADRNLHAFGYDMYTDSIRRAAMDRSHELRVASLSAKIMPRQEPDQDASPEFLMFLPIYTSRNHAKNGKHNPTILMGWVYAQFRADELISVLSDAHREKIDLTIYDGEEVSEPARLSGTNLHAASITPHRDLHLHTTRPITIAGRVWTLEAHSLPKLEANFDHDKPLFILISGIGISLLLALLMQMLIHGRAHAIEIANEMNRELIRSEYRWKYALEGAGESVWDWDIKSGYMFKSNRLREILGYDNNEYPDTFDSWQQSVHPEDRKWVMDALTDYLEGKTNEVVIECRLTRKDGNWVWIVMRGMAVSRDDLWKPLRMIGTIADITDRHKKDESMRLSSTVFETMREAVMITDANGNIVTVNPSFTKITGFTPEEVIGKDPLILSVGLEPSDTLSAMQDTLKATGSCEGEVIHRRKTGELYVSWVSVGSVRNQKGVVANHVTVFSDISERKANEARMQYLAHFDPLTDLPNRALFNDRLRQALAACRRNQSRLAVLFVDLDKFKPVNDTLGHSVGDLLLKEVSYRLLDSIRESDSAARLGGDEFVVLLSGIETESDAITVAEKILSSIREPFRLDKHVIQISASVGIAVYPNHGHSDHELLSNADEAMYLIKHAGGSGVASFSEVQSKKLV